MFKYIREKLNEIFEEYKNKELNNLENIYSEIVNLKKELKNKEDFILKINSKIDTLITTLKENNRSTMKNKDFDELLMAASDRGYAMAIKEMEMNYNNKIQKFEESMLRIFENNNQINKTTCQE